MGAQFIVGLASQVPDLNIGSIFGGVSLIILAQLPMAINFFIPSEKQVAKEVADKWLVDTMKQVAKEVADKWLVDTMKQVLNITKSFDVHKVIYGQDNAKAKWLGCVVNISH